MIRGSGGVCFLDRPEGALIDSLFARRPKKKQQHCLHQLRHCHRLRSSRHHRRRGHRFRRRRLRCRSLRQLITHLLFARISFLLKHL